MAEKEETRGLQAEATEEEYQVAGSKFVTFPPGAKRGDKLELDIEMGFPDWETPESSYKFPVTVTEDGPDNGKEDKIVGGATAKGIWKTKDIVRAVTGKDMPMAKDKEGKKHPVLVPDDIGGKPAVGLWQMQEGHKGGDPNAEIVLYPKLVSILPVGSKVESLM